MAKKNRIQIRLAFHPACLIAFVSGSFILQGYRQFHINQDQMEGVTQSVTLKMTIAKNEGCRIPKAPKKPIP
jgi:hypothetical protein